MEGTNHEARKVAMKVPKIWTSRGVHEPQHCFGCIWLSKRTPQVGDHLTPVSRVFFGLFCIHRGWTTGGYEAILIKPASWIECDEGCGSECSAHVSWKHCISSTLFSWRSLEQQKQEKQTETETRTRRRRGRRRRRRRRRRRKKRKKRKNKNNVKKNKKQQETTWKKHVPCSLLATVTASLDLHHSLHAAAACSFRLAIQRCCIACKFRYTE